MSMQWYIAGFAIFTMSYLYFTKRRSSSSYHFWTKILRHQLFRAPKKTLASSKQGVGLEAAGHKIIASLQEAQVSLPSFSHAPKGFESLESEAYLQLESSLRKIEKHFLPANQEKKNRLLGETLIDQRTFWDCFRSQSSAIVMLYHLDTMRVIFVSSSVKKLFGCSSADFRHKFHDFLHDLEAWKRPLSQLKVRQRLYAPLAFKAENGKGRLGIYAWDAYIAELNRGYKNSYAVVLLYPAYNYSSKSD